MILPDVLEPGLDVVFCGTRVSARSFHLGAYYAGQGNRFWDILHQTGLTPKMVAPQGYYKLAGYGIGLTDLAKTSSGGDSGIKKHEFDTAGLRAKVEQYFPKVLAFNGKRAAAEFLGCRTGQLEYGLQRVNICRTALFVLPSTSGAARACWDERHWYDLAKLIGKLPHTHV